MDKMTITEGLAELKTIDNRINNKRTFVKNNLARQEFVKDPLEKDGGQFKAVESEIQSLKDLLLRKITIRNSIQTVNQITKIFIKDREMSIANWIVWKREILPVEKAFYNELSSGIANLRRDAMSKGLKISDGQNASPQDVIVNVNESWLKQTIENLSEIEGTLDGQLSLRNATVVIEV
jgi:hypothetical protein